MSVMGSPLVCRNKVNAAHAQAVLMHAGSGQFCRFGGPDLVSDCFLSAAESLEGRASTFAVRRQEQLVSIWYHVAVFLESNVIHADLGRSTAFMAQGSGGESARCRGQDSPKWVRISDVKENAGAAEARSSFRWPIMEP